MTSDLIKENERLKKLLMAKERLAFLGKISPFVRHQLVGDCCWMRDVLDLMKKEFDEQEEAIQLMRSLVDEEKYPDEVDDSLERFYDAQNRVEGYLQSMEKLIYNCLNLGELYLPFTVNEVSEISIGFELFDFNQFLTKCCYISRSSFREKNYQNNFSTNLVINCQEDFPLFWGVPSSLQFVFINLVENAYDAIKEKLEQPELSEEQGTVIVESQYEKGFLVVNVKDNGIGIKPDLLDKVFEPLFSTKSKNAKSGAGLSLSKDLLKTDYNATIEVDSNSEFTTFTIKFPLFCSLEAED